jgi:uncharacterized membrane protein
MPVACDMHPPRGMTQGTPSPDGARERPAEPRSPAGPPANTASPDRADRRPGEPRSPAVAPPPVVPRKPLSAYLPAENVAAALSYLFGWIGGLIVLLVDRRPYVRFHAAQSVVVFGTLSVFLLVLGGFLLETFLPQAAAALLLLRRVVELVWLVTAILLMLKASSGERYRVPYAALLADRAVGING